METYKQIKTLIPSFSYTRKEKGSHKNFSIIKEKLLEVGAVIEEESSNRILLSVSSNSFSFALFPLIKDLKIDLGVSADDVFLKVVRYGERRMYLGFFIFSLILALIIGINEPKILFLPVICYFIMIFHSVLPTHPAHIKIRKLFNDSLS